MARSDAPNTRQNFISLFVCAGGIIFIALLFAFFSQIIVPGARWLPVNVFACFLATLLFSHLLFFVTQEFISKQVGKIIDYVYLSVAAIGLLFGVLQYANQQYNEDNIRLFDHATALFEENIADFRVLEGGCKSYEKKDGGLCFNFFDKVNHFEAAVRNFKATRTKESLFDTMNIFSSTHEAYLKTGVAKDYASDPSAPTEIDKQEDVWHKEDKDIIRASLIKLTRDTPFVHEGRYAYFRYVGLFLIASSLALRITKVSIEFFCLLPGN